SAGVRAALEHAAGVLAAIRRGRPGESPRGDRLVVLRESCDQLFGLVIALGDVVETIPRARRDAALQEELAAALGDAIDVVTALATGVLDERDRPGPAIIQRGARMRGLLDARGASLGPTERAQYEHAALVVERMEQFAAVASAVLSRMGSAQPALPDPSSLSVAEEGDERGSLLAPLAAVLDHDSLVLRYALRVGIVTALAVWLTGQFAIPHGYWVTITAVVILQPYSGATTVKAMQRLLGTVLGGILTAALGAALHDPRWILVLSFLFAGICVAVLPINYALFSMFLTPTFVLLAEVGTGDWHLAEVRVLNTLLGASLALLGSRLLWPRPEWSRFPTYAAAVLRENADFLRIVARDFGDRGEAATARMRAGRRRAGLAAINAEESFQRLMGEHRGGAEGLAPLLTFLTYARRFGASIAALATSRHAVDAGTAGVLEGFTARTTTALERGARQLEAHDVELRLTAEHPTGVRPAAPAAPAGAPPGPSVRTPSAASVVAPALETGDLVVRARLERLERQLALLLDSARAIAEG
ncbi:MAG TPA: FUSC family protein, partial [Gemmatimonadaceae bacterium]